MMSMSMESRLALSRWGISEVPPLKRNGQLERDNASSKEKARMVFSTRARSFTLLVAAVS